MARRPTKAVHIPVFAATSKSDNYRVCEEFNHEGRKLGLSDVHFHPCGVYKSDRFGWSEASPEDKEHVRVISAGRPLIVSVTPFHEQMIREAFEHTGETPPRIITVCERHTKRRPTNVVLREIADHLRREGHM